MRDLCSLPSIQFYETRIRYFVVESDIKKMLSLSSRVKSRAVESASGGKFLLSKAGFHLFMDSG